MFEAANHLGTLIRRSLDNTLDDEGRKELEEWISISDANRVFFDRITTEEELEKELDVFRSFDQVAAFKRLMENNKSLQPAKVVPYYRRKAVQVTAAAAMLLLVTGLAVFKITGDGTGNPADMVGLSATSSSAGQDMGRTTLTLADGQTIVLEDNKGEVGMQGTSRVNNSGVRLSYENENTGHGLGDNIPFYNTLTTFKGHIYEVKLSDGSTVKLNNKSSLKYPTAFNGQERVVELNGEAYFEIAEDSKHPFRVKVGSIYVNVLGTHFNVSSFPEDGCISTTLLEGKVQVEQGKSTAVLVPGQQARATTGEAVTAIVVKDVDTEYYMAWKNNDFNFMHADLRSVCRQLSRWYDVEMAYEGTEPEFNYTGMVSRNNTLEDVLDILKESGLKVTRKGRNILVK